MIILKSLNFTQISKNLVLILVLLFSNLSFAELKFGITGQVHSSLKVIQDKPAMQVDRARFGFNTYTPNAFAKLSLDFANTSQTSSQALSSIINEVYSGKDISEKLKIYLGLKHPAYGTLNRDQYDVLGYDDSHTLLELQPAVGVTLNYQINEWFWDIGLYQPAYRSIAISTDSRLIENFDDAYLFSTRFGYQMGQLLYAQISYAKQNYSKDYSNTQAETSVFYDLIFDIDWSPFWGSYLRYTSVDGFQGQKGNSQYSKKVQIDWHPSRYWQMFLSSYEIKDDHSKQQTKIIAGAVYKSDKHSKVLINTNLNSNNKDYDGFLGDSYQDLFVEYQFNF